MSKFYCALWTLNLTYRNTQPAELFYKKAALKHFADSQKNILWSLFLIKLQVWRPTNLLKWYSNPGVFLWILRKKIYFEEQSTPTLKKICERLLLYWMSPVKNWAKVFNILKNKRTNFICKIGTDYVVRNYHLRKCMFYPKLEAHNLAY